MASWDVATGSWGAVLRLTVNVTSQNVAANQSTLSVQLSIHGVPTSTVRGTPAVDCAVSGIGSSVSSTFTWPSGNTSRTLITFSRVVNHNADGTLTISVAGSIGATATGGLGGPTMNGAHSFTLPTIARASTSTVNLNPVNAGQNLTITTNRATTAFTHTLTWRHGSQSGTIATGVGASYVWAVPLSILARFPNATSSTFTLRTATYSGTTLIGTRDTAFIIGAPSSAVPSFTTVTHSEGTPNVATLIGGYVQNISRLVLAITEATGYQGSTITGYRIAVAGQTINSASGTSAVINASGTVPIVATITDSRGRTASKTVNATFLEYTTPSIDPAVFSVRRADDSGTPTEEGDRIRFDFRATVQSLVVGSEKNNLVYRLYVKQRGTSAWGNPVKTVTASDITLNSFDYVGTYSAEQSWDVQLSVSDRFSVSTATATVATASIFMHWGNGLGVGKFHEQGALDVGGAIYQNNGSAVVDEGTLAAALSVLLPAGLLMSSARSSAPTGWLLCQGQAISRTIYVDLFAAIGTTYGSGNGSSTFNVPDLRGRVPVGLQPDDVDFGVLNAKGGAKTHTLTTAQMPSHTHTQNSHRHTNVDGSHTFLWGQGNATIWANNAVVTAGAPPSNQMSSRQNIYNQTNVTTATNQNTGSGSAHPNLQPYITLNYIIKI